jgi:ubiquinone/menaquinone biosynthesis C-methylase UbiE
MDIENNHLLINSFFLLKKRKLLSNVYRALDFEKGASVLDLGCGPGVWIMLSGLCLVYNHNLLTTSSA